MNGPTAPVSMIGGSQSPTPVKSSIGESHALTAPTLPESTVAARGRAFLAPDMRTGVIESERARLGGGIETEGRGGSVQSGPGGVDGALSVAVVSGVLPVTSDVSELDLRDQRGSNRVSMDVSAEASPDSSSCADGVFSAGGELEVGRARAGSGANGCADAESGDDGALTWPTLTSSSERDIAVSPTESDILGCTRESRVRRRPADDECTKRRGHRSLGQCRAHVSGTT